jgi:transposase
VGYDASKKVKGCKIHALVDTEGLPLRVVVHSAAIQDRDGAALVFDRIRQRFNWLELVWADGGYNARQVQHAVAAQPPLRVEIVKRPEDSSGFIVLPRRWLSNGPFRGSAETAVWPKITRTSLIPSRPSSHSLASSSPSGGSPGRRLLSHALSPPRKTIRVRNKTASALLAPSADSRD